MAGGLGAWGFRGPGYRVSVVSSLPPARVGHKCGPIHKSGSGCLPAGPVRSSFGRTETLLPFL